MMSARVMRNITARRMLARCLERSFLSKNPASHFTPLIPVTFLSSCFYRAIARTKIHLPQPNKSTPPTSAPKSTPPCQFSCQIIALFSSLQTPCQCDGRVPSNTPDKFLAPSNSPSSFFLSPIHLPCQIPNPFHSPPRTRPISHPVIRHAPVQFPLRPFTVFVSK